MADIKLIGNTYSNVTQIKVPVSDGSGYAVFDYSKTIADRLIWVKNKFSKFTDSYISQKGCEINGKPVSREKLQDYLLNRDNCKYCGKLKMQGTKLVSATTNTPVEIRGIGTHALLQYQNLHTKECFETLKYQGVNCVRLSAYLGDWRFSKSDDKNYIGYINSESETKAEIERIVDICILLDLYVILDWHVMQVDVTRETGEIAYLTEAEQFFTYYAQKYADTPNVFYEFMNEPYFASQEYYTTYVSTCRDAVKKYVTDPVMLCGNTLGGVERCFGWLKTAGIEDVFVTNHFYGDKLDLGFIPAAPYFISEWGNGKEAGGGSTLGDLSSAKKFMDDMHNKCIPNCVWKFTDQTSVWSILKNRGAINDVYYREGWNASDQTENGNLYLENFSRYAFEDHIDRGQTEIYYKVKNELVNCSTNNRDESVIQGAQYSAKITPNSGYTLIGSNVQITMNSVDITSTSYDNGNISIKKVTGDIKISVTAVLTEPTVQNYSIINHLENCKNQNSIAEIKKGEKYQATLLADKGFTLKNAHVIVKMNGVDVTSTVYNNGNITINSVTGNVEITASAIKEDTVEHYPFIDADITAAGRHIVISNGNRIKIDKLVDNENLHQGFLNPYMDKQSENHSGFDDKYCTDAPNNINRKPELFTIPAGVECKLEVSVISGKTTGFEANFRKANDGKSSVFGINEHSLSVTKTLQSPEKIGCFFAYIKNECEHVEVEVKFTVNGKRWI